MNWIREIRADPWTLAEIIFVLALANAFLPPVPLESATLLSGFLAGSKRGSLAGIAGAATLGMSIGGTILYLLGGRHGKAILAKTPLLGISDPYSFNRAVAWFDRFGLWALILGRILPGLSLAATIACGFLRYKPGKALPAIVGSNLVFFAALALLGRFLGDRWAQAAEWLGKLGVLVLGAGSIAGLLVLRRLFARLLK